MEHLVNELVLLFAVSLVSVGVYLWLSGQNVRRDFLQFCDSQVRHSDMKLEDWAVLQPIQSSGFYKCSGCDSWTRMRGPGYRKVGEGFEFCSQLCYDEPLPFPSVNLDMN